jgi:hypothetical protein
VFVQAPRTTVLLDTSQRRLMLGSTSVYDWLPVVGRVSLVHVELEAAVVHVVFSTRTPAMMLTVGPKLCSICHSRR